MSKFFDDVFSQYEAELLATTKVEMEAERKAWQELPQAERDRILAEREAKLASFECDDTDDDTDEDEEE